MAKIYAVGDIFGCANELDVILGSIDLSDNNVVVFLGNYIDKGPDSRSVVGLISDLQDNYGSDHVIALQGKHEEAFLAWLDDPESAQWFMEDEDLATCSTFMNKKTWESFEQVLGDSAENMGMNVVYDVAHNIAKMETHDYDGHKTEVLVHRKGATRAFAPGRAEITQKYRDYGQPVLIPGDMSTGTYVLAGRKGAMTDTFGSTCHGAGRQMSRKAAIENLNLETVRKKLADEGIYLRNGSDAGLLEEAPDAYKDVNEIIEVVCNAGLTGKVAKLTPIGVVKG